MSEATAKQPSILSATGKADLDEYYKKLNNNLEVLLTDKEIKTYLRANNRSFGEPQIYQFKLKLKHKLLYSKYAGGYDRQIYGISTSAYDSGAATNTGFGNSVTEGWVGVTTYMGVEGEMRVKHEVLVAATGISTGDYGILYPTDQGGF